MPMAPAYEPRVSGSSLSCSARVMKSPSWPRNMSARSGLAGSR
ncbi:Uncharacterised protein [Bordetella pertussis]|nr:Uncharacterised protein [Bordetella pertussis]